MLLCTAFVMKQHHSSASAFDACAGKLRGIAAKLAAIAEQLLSGV
jgi:hypothetical protein